VGWCGLPFDLSLPRILLLRRIRCAGRVHARPETVHLAADTKFGNDVTIEPFVTDLPAYPLTVLCRLRVGCLGPGLAVYNATCEGHDQLFTRLGFRRAHTYSQH
jgi:hypothetical protein